MKNFELESFEEGGRHSQMVKAPTSSSDYHSKGCVFNPDPIAVSRIICLSLLLCAKICLASPPPDFISFASGAFDLLRPRSTTWEFEAEYKFHIKRLKSPYHFLEFRPLVGLMMTARGSGYLYGGINFDLLCWDHLLIAPGFAAGYYWEGRGKNLGYPLEFRSGVELAWQFSDWHRLGIHFYHLSNASLSRRNPGEESLVLYYDIPISKGFPFHRDKCN